MLGRGPAPGWFPMARPVGLLATEAFRRADADKDGKLTLDEIPSDRQEGFKRLLKTWSKCGIMVNSERCREISFPYSKGGKPC